MRSGTTRTLGNNETPTELTGKVEPLSTMMVEGRAEEGVREKRCYRSGVRCGVVGHAKVDHPDGNKWRGSEHHAAERVGEKLLVPLSSPQVLGWRLL
jgi:hypothetical protein